MPTLVAGQNIPPVPKIVKSPLLAQPGQVGGQLTDSSTRKPKSLNPAVEYDDFLQLINSTLLEVNPLTLAFEPALAESFEVTPDKKELRLVIRQVKFSDGTPFTADDVLFTLNDILLNPELQSAFQSAGLIFVAPKGMQIQKKDARTVVIRMTQGGVADAKSLLLLLSNFKMLPKHKLGSRITKGNPNLFTSAWGLDSSPSDLATLGPFKLLEMSSNQIKLVKNPYYWKVDEKGAQLPYIEKMSRIFIDSSDEALGLFQTGKLDLLNVRPTDAVKLPDQKNLIIDGSALTVNFLTFNQDVSDRELQTLFRDGRFRQAVAYAINRPNAIAQTGNQVPFLMERESFVHALSPYFSQQMTPKYEFNLTKAAQLLDQVGIRDRNGDKLRDFPSGKPVQFQLVTNQDNVVRTAFAEQLVANLKNLGIIVNYRAVPFSELSARVNFRTQPPQAEYEAMIISYTSGVSPVDTSYLLPFFHSKGLFHLYRYSDSQAGSLTSTQRRFDEFFSQVSGAEMSNEESNKLLGEFQKLLATELPLIPLYSTRVTIAAKKGIHNIQMINVLGITPFLELIWRDL
jgi:peptide/nickel transport system substrate-binding protein